MCCWICAANWSCVWWWWEWSELGESVGPPEDELDVFGEGDERSDVEESCCCSFMEHAGEEEIETDAILDESRQSKCTIHKLREGHSRFVIKSQARRS